MPFGVSLEANGVARFTLFAPSADHVFLALEGAAELVPMVANSNGWHELRTSSATAGSRYRFVLPDGTRVPDPASRYQPEDVHGPSEVIDPSSFHWTDDQWRGRPWIETVLYELHVGTFTKEGTFRAAMEKLDHLVELGVTAIELMCLSDFAGNRNWGYDGVLIYAPDSAYGPPNEVKAFINAAHVRGLMVILDVVYNHLGPEGNFIPQYFPQINSDRHETPWGRALNFDGEHGGVVREFILHNALYWIEEFHVDGLRLDASHAMTDDSPKHILEELHERVQALACGRPIHLILENENNTEGRVGRDKSGEPNLYAAQWNHDITHLLGAAFSDLCEPSQIEETGKLAKALAEGFVIAAQMKEEAPPCSVPPTAFISFIQTHDLVGNRVFGDRIFANAPAATIRAIAAVYLLAPQIPMLFMGEEWGASTPFPFFCDYHGELAEAVKKGRCDQLIKLDPAPSEDELRRAPDPQAESTLRSAQLDWRELDRPRHAEWFHWYKQLIKVRSEFIVPHLSGLSQRCASSLVVGPGAIAISWTLRDNSKLNLAANLCKKSTAGFPSARGKVIWQEGSQESEDQLGPWAVRWIIEPKDL
jgi:malto-oligosyltrehalose trehalohydrolase